MRFVRTLLLTVASFMPAAALAEPATQAGADELTTLFQSYLGTTAGVVTVAPEGESYGVKLDFALLLAKAPLDKFDASVSPLQLRLTDQGDGTWAYQMDQPVSLAYTIPDGEGGQSKTETNYGSVKLSGSFDEALGASRTMHMEMTDVATVQSQAGGGLGAVVVNSRTKLMVMDGRAVEGAAGVDGRYAHTASDTEFSVAIAGASPEPISITGTIADGSFDIVTTGHQPIGLLGLWSWFIAHPSEELIKADRASLKPVIEKALPLFGNVKMDGAYRTVAVETPLGPFLAAELGVTADINGIVADGKVREALTVKGLKIPEGLVPPFAATLVPNEVSLDFAASGFDAAAGAALGLGLLDLPDGAVPPAGFEGQLLSAVLPDGMVDITIAPGAVVAPDYKLTYQAAFAAGPARPTPVGTAKLTLVGMEAIQKALQSAPPEMGGQAMMMVGMAGGMAKPGADGELVWDIEMTEAGGLLVNGVDMAAMMGGQ
ncbi:hypothetical protein OU426_13070 [Frigidibacter sp. RF13]|uniref:hypothetical protein n=1 Tax=Frigidibacter sp. RF13 TaxID=2997340 RepID=UPI0022700AFD|nr:hypothetical protein [Frigidibacter sp. RF13]MCY1127789.1 hypothetical protein [Frigidibacter sp. RF13]